MSTLAPMFLTREQAAEVCNVSMDTVRRAINTGALRAKRTGKEGGGKYLISPDALREWFDSLEDA